MDLLSQCRVVDEVAQILHRRNPDTDIKKQKPGRWERVTRAIECEQRKVMNCHFIFAVGKLVIYGNPNAIMFLPSE